MFYHFDLVITLSWWSVSYSEIYFESSHSFFHNECLKFENHLGVMPFLHLAHLKLISPEKNYILKLTSLDTRSFMLFLVSVWFQSKHSFLGNEFLNFDNTLGAASFLRDSHLKLYSEEYFHIWEGVLHYPIKKALFYAYCKFDSNRSNRFFMMNF